MTRRDLESAVAAATGEDVREIRRRGFSVLNLRQRDFDPEPDNQLPQALEVQQSAVALRPDDPFLRLNLARFYAQANQKKQAKAELDRLALLGDRFARQAEVAAQLKALGGR